MPFNDLVNTATAAKTNILLIQTTISYTGRVCHLLRRLGFVVMTISQTTKNRTGFPSAVSVEFGASNEVRTRDLDLGKVALYQLSYTRIGQRLA